MKASKLFQNSSLVAAIALVVTLGLSGQGVPSVTAAPNPIVVENSLAGSPASEWGLEGSGDPSIQGFATEISVNRGQTVAFKIDTTATAYRIDIYRLGYYGGSGARKVATLNPSASLPQIQPACMVDLATGLVDCGNWGVSASWTVPATATSGVYLARPVRTDTGGASLIVFIVRDDAGSSDILFQTSDTTWQAYNLYGGANLYLGNGPGYQGRASKVSYNRPFANRRDAQAAIDRAAMEGFLFGAEYPMIRWLESNGYNVSYASGVDTDRRGVAALVSHRVFISVGHDEYWSGQQRANVESARAAGVHLGFFSGNEMFWKTRWENSIANPSATYRTLVCYKETQVNAKIDPTSTWTGTWRDPRFSPPGDGGRPENAVSGQLYNVDAFRHDPIFISSSQGKLRFWRNTGIDTLADGQFAQLPAGVLGFEWDEIVDNGWLPAGLFRMSETTIAVDKYLQDHGGTYAPGVATHSLSLYRHSSGALVFGAGTINWPRGLDSTHDGAGPGPDTRMQQATVNLFADMGVQPVTLQAGLVSATPSTDTVPPTSVIQMPPGQTVIAGSAVTIVGTATDAGGGRPAGVEFSLDGGATWHPATGAADWTATWIPEGAGVVNIKSRAVDDSGRIEVPQAGINVTVAPRLPKPIVGLDFNDGNGSSAIDASGQGNLGVLLNGASWTEGKAGSAVHFDGVDDIVRIGNSASLNTATAGITVAAWVYRESNQGHWATIASRQVGTSALEPWGLMISDDGKYRWFVNTAGGGYSDITVGGAAPVGQWVHLAGTYDGITVRLFVNGVQHFAVPHTGPLADAAGGAVTLGAAYNDGTGLPGEALFGKIDDFQMFNRALNVSQVQSLFAGLPPSDPDGTSPTVVAATPISGASTVSTATSVSAQFNESIAPWTLTSSLYAYPYPNPLFAFNPATDLSHTEMLRDFRLGKEMQFTLTQVPAGTYDVYVWTFEDDVSQTATLTVEGRVVGSFTSGGAGRWERLGPFRVVVNDGDIEVGVQSGNGLVYVSGLEIWQGGGAAPATPPATSTFYRAINLGGPVMAMDGNTWEANDTSTPNFMVNGSASQLPSVTFSPALPTANYETMLRTFRYSAKLELDITGVPNDTYNVFAWTFEDNASLNASLSLDGIEVLSGYNTGQPGHWERLGPFPVTVKDQAIQLDYVCNTPGDQGVLSGVELWRTYVPLTPPTGTFFRAINVGGPAMVIDGNRWEGEDAANYRFNGGVNPFTLRDAQNNEVSASVTYDVVTRVARLQPTSALKYNSAYTATIKGGTTGVSDLAGNKLAADIQWSFNTEPAAQAASPTFSLGSGTYQGAQTVSLSDASSGAVIYYTTDGSVPTIASTRYTASLLIAKTTTIKAIAVVSGWLDSNVSSASYKIVYPPGSTLTAPADGATFAAPANVAMAASATDTDGTITKVEFFQGATKVGEATTSPFNCVWTGVAPGNYVLTVKAYDNDGESTVSRGVRITVNASNNSPTVSITSPASGASFTAPASLTIAANASDVGGSVSKVEFYQGTTLLGQDTTSPYSFTWTSVGAGNYTLTAKAYDNLGASTTSQAVNISVINNAPTVSITSPSSGASFTAPASLTITANASDVGGSISKVEFYQGTTLLGQDTTSPYSFTWTGVGAGNYTLTAKAYDKLGASTTSQAVNISVINKLPTVSITSPAVGATFVAPASLTITANASDVGGSISKVEFYQGKTLLGQDTTSPYSFTWTGVAAGAYSITARAYDNLGASTTSASVSISVRPVDTTAPSAPAVVRDGTGQDLTQTTAWTRLSANWNASADAQSGIKRYWYAIGTSPGASNTVDWTDNGTATSVTKQGLFLNRRTYYFTIRAENGDGLLSAPVSSDGQMAGAFFTF